VASEAGRLRLDEPALQLLLGLVLHGREQLQEPLEPVLVQVAGEALVAAEPALAWRFYDPLSERLPGWDYALLKAADLSLQRGDLERCRAHLSRGMELHGQNPWLHDIAARLAVAEGAVEQALEAWQRATACCADQPEEPRAQMLELFRQRAREARRGPGVLQARSLIHRGETAAAVALLQTLLEQDPQWQPLRSLLEQAQAPAAGGTEPMDNTGGSNLDRLEQRLRLLAERANLAWPVAAAAEGTSTDAEGWERHLQQALGRLALLG
jgi:tetratricopeptide (TPR) repeat protein